MKWVKHQLTIDQALTFNRSGLWSTWSPEQIVRYQLFQNGMMVDFGHFLKCLDIVFKRSIHMNQVFNREDRTNLIREYLRKHEPPMCDELRELLGERAHLVGL
jgi:hypothetical protein